MKNEQDINMLPVQSSNVEAIGYSDGSLYVRYRDGGRLYCYRKVPPAIYVDMLMAKSKGRFLNEQVKPFFECEEVVDGKAA